MGSGQNGPEDHSDPAGLTHPGGRGRTRPVREFRMSAADRVGNAIFSMFTRAGIGPAHLLGLMPALPEHPLGTTRVSR
jgi:hypothetical protein